MFPTSFLVSLCLISSLFFSLSLAKEKPNYMNPQNGWKYQGLHTFGETVGDYTPPGIGDGLGAFWNSETKTVWVISNHELGKTTGYPYTLENGVEMTGARLTIYEFSKEGELVSARQGIKTVYDREGKLVEHPSQINELSPTSSSSNTSGFDRFCSGGFYPASPQGLEDSLYLLGEETATYFGHPQGGSIWAFEPHTQTIYGLPDFGRGAWEQAAPVPVADGYVAFVTTNDRLFATPLTLYVGKKNPSSSSLLERNGLKGGKLYAWFSETGETELLGAGTGTTLKGYFAPVTVQDTTKAGQAGYDQHGYLNDNIFVQGAFEQGAFQCARPEDASPNPHNSSEVIISFTGLGSTNSGATNWGGLILLQIDGATATSESERIRADLTAYYDGGDFNFQDFGVRNPDNLFWASNGHKFICEDKATSESTPTTGCSTESCFLNAFGGRSSIDTSVWMMPETTTPPSSVAELSRLAIVNRHVELPEGTTDSDSETLGVWEISGLREVSNLFDFPGQLLIGNVQAHTIVDGVIKEKNLGEGGQLFFLSKVDDFHNTALQLKTSIKSKGSKKNLHKVMFKVKNQESYTIQPVSLVITFDGPEIDLSEAMDECFVRSEKNDVQCQTNKLASGKSWKFVLYFDESQGNKVNVETWATLAFENQTTTTGLVSQKTVKLADL